MLDPTREGRQLLTDAIRAELAHDGTLGADAITATTLEPLGLTRAEASNAASYAPGQIVTFRRGSREQRLSRDAPIGWRGSMPTRARSRSPPRRASPSLVARAMGRRSGRSVRRGRTGVSHRGQHPVHPQQPARGAIERAYASVVGIDPQRGGITVEREDGKQEALDLTRLADRHIRPGWVRTIHSAQGTTADRVMAHLESFRANTVDAPAVYVAIAGEGRGRALHRSRARLTGALGLRDSAQIGAIDEARGERSGWPKTRCGSNFLDF